MIIGPSVDQVIQKCGLLPPYYKAPHTLCHLRLFLFEPELEVWRTRGSSNEFHLTAFPVPIDVYAQGKVH